MAPCRGKAHARDSLRALSKLGEIVDGRYRIVSRPPTVVAFDRSITDFSERYANQTEKDFQGFVTAVRSGRLEALEGV